jgi:hypothetical protein
VANGIVIDVPEPKNAPPPFVDVYHLTEEPVPAIPPLALSVVFVFGQIVPGTKEIDGDVDNVLTETVTFDVD